MNRLIAIFFGMALVNNMVLVKFLGLCPFFGVSKKTKSAVSMGIAVTLVMLVASAVTWPIYYYLLVPYGVEVMKTVIFILVIASLVQIIEMAIKRTNLTLYNALGIYLPLITTNCAVLGVCLINIKEEYSFVQTLAASFSYAVGFGLALVLFAGVRERIILARVPRPLQDTSIGLVTAGMLSLAFFAFKGMV